MVRLIGFVAAAILLAAPVVHGQGPPRVRAESLVTAARASARAGDTTEALRLSRLATQVDDKFAGGHFLYGQLLARSTTLGFSDLYKRQQAANSLNRAINIAGEEPWALIELGRLRMKMPFMRLAAEQLFSRALRAADKTGDPAAVAEVRYELGRIYDRRFRSQANRYELLGDVGMLNPDEAQYDIHYVENFLANHARPIPDMGELDAATAEDHYRKALEVFPGHEDATSAYSAILYENKRYAEMASIARSAAAQLPASARVRLAQGLALLHLGQYQRANEVFKAAAARMTDRERQMIMSIGPLMRSGDARRYEAMDSRGRTDLEQLFWDANDPLLLTAMNEYHLAFMGRVAYADLFFSMPERGIRGSLTDRGKIVLSYGMPPIQAVFPPQVAVSSNMDAVGNLTTLWFYPSAKLKFIFIGPPAMDGAWFAGDFRNYAAEVKEVMPMMFAEIPWAPVMDTIPIQVGRFRGDQPWNTRVEFHAAMPVPHLVNASGLASVPVETAFMILDGAMSTLVDARDTTTLAADGPAVRHRSWERQFRPGEYVYRIEALEPQSMHGAAAKGPMSLLSFDPGVFSVSDVLVAKAMSLDVAEPTRRADVTLDIVPDNTLDPGDALSLYWETYGAKPGDDGTVRFDVDISLTVLELTRAPVLHARLLGGLADRLGVSDEGERTVTLQYPRTAAAPPSADDRTVHTITIELAGAPPAQYLLEIKMTDIVSGQTATSRRVFYVRRPQ
jgi:GWxTD domain-containing protein